MLNVWAPAASAALAGRIALVSLEVRPIRSVTLVTTFQFASTAFTVTVKGFSAVWTLAVPVLPLEVPGAAISPGRRICNFEEAVAARLMVGGLLPLMLWFAVGVTGC